MKLEPGTQQNPGLELVERREFIVFRPQVLQDELELSVRRASADAFGEAHHPQSSASIHSLFGIFDRRDLRIRFNPRWMGSLTLYYMDDVHWRGEGSEVDAYTRLDLKLARDFQLGAGGGQGQVAFIVQNLTGNEYNEFRVPGARDRNGNVFDRRAYVQMSLQFD